MTTAGSPVTGGGGAGPEFRYPRRRSIVGPIILIGIGVLFLMGTVRPEFDPWWVFWRFWPLLLIFVGIGKIADYYWNREPDGTRRHALSATAIAVLLCLVLLAVLGWYGGDHSWYARRPFHDWTWEHRWDRGRDWDGRTLHEARSVELQGAKRVTADIDIPAGSVTLTGGSDKLLDASFDYEDYVGKPRIDYTVSGDHGQLDITQNSEDHVNWGGNREDDWNLRLGGGVPIDLKLTMGAGQSNLQMSDVDLSRLEVHVGAGEVHLDLTGPRKNDLDATIQGGVGSATIRLPKDVGVRVTASGGIGAVNAPGLERDGDAYINAAYGKTPATINLTVAGGVGEINLYEE